MNMRHGSIVYQTKEIFRQLDAIGQPKVTGDGKIHSIQTMKTYLHHALRFVSWCRQEYGCRTPEECLPYAKEWIERDELSTFTRKLMKAALIKMYGHRQELDNVDTGNRSRAAVKRSRGTATRDRHFSEIGRYKKYVEFCRATGLRKAEMEALRGTALFYDQEGKPWLRVTTNTKGGRHRNVPVIGSQELVENVCKAAGGKKVIEGLTGRLKAPGGADTHSYRADYAMKLYEMLARPIWSIPEEDRYRCRKELAGVVYDKRAMQQVSQALGHTRVNVIAQSYIRPNG